MFTPFINRNRLCNRPTARPSALANASTDSSPKPAPNADAPLFHAAAKPVANACCPRVWSANLPAIPRLELGRNRILRNRADFDRIRRDGQRVVGRLLVCNYLSEPSLPTRAAFVVGKACGGAVIRNRLKRRLREIYRRFAQSQLIPGLQSVWIARQNAAPAEFAKLRDEMLRLYLKAGLTTGTTADGDA